MRHFVVLFSIKSIENIYFDRVFTFFSRPAILKINLSRSQGCPVFFCFFCICFLYYITAPYTIHSTFLRGSSTIQTHSVSLYLSIFFSSYFCPHKSLQIQNSRTKSPIVKLQDNFAKRETQLSLKKRKENICKISLHTRAYTQIHKTCTR